MSKTAFHADPDRKGAIVLLLEEHGYEVEPGSGPMVDFVVEPTEEKANAIETPADQPDGDPHFTMRWGNTASGDGIHINKYVEDENGERHQVDEWAFAWVEVFEELIGETGHAPEII